MPAGKRAAGNAGEGDGRPAGKQGLFTGGQQAPQADKLASTSKEISTCHGAAFIPSALLQRKSPIWHYRRRRSSPIA